MTELDDGLTDAEEELAETIDDAVRDALDADVSVESIIACLDAHKMRVTASAAEIAVEEGMIDAGEVPDDLQRAQRLLEAGGGDA